MPFNKELPEWKATGIQPPESKRVKGWEVEDRPPADWLNWQMNTTYEALQELQEKAAEKDDVSKALKDAKEYTDQKAESITPESIGAETPTGAQAKADAAKKAAEQKIAEHAGNTQVHVSATDRQEWDGAAEEVSDAREKELTFTPGLQVVESEQDAPFQMGEVKGRTLINLLGKEGNFDYRSSRLFTFFGTGEIIPAPTPVGTKVQKIVCNRTDTAHFGARFELDIDRSKHYVAMTYMENVNCDVPVYFSVAEFKSTGYVSIEKSASLDKGSGMSYLYTTIAPAQMENREKLIYYFRGEGTGGAEFRIGPFAFYEITQPEYDAIAKMTTEQVAERYPYVDSMTNVKNPYAIVTGGNLLPPFYEWVTGSGSKIIDQYELVSTYETGAGNAVLWNTVDIKVIAGANYVLSVYNSVKDARNIIIFYDKSGAKIELEPWDGVTQVPIAGQNIVKYKAPDNAVTLRIHLYGNPAEGTTITFKNPMLTIGTEPKPFTPQQRSMLAFETELAANPVDGSNPDTLFLGDDGLPYVLEPWGKVTLTPEHFDDAVAYKHSNDFKQITLVIQKRDTTALNATISKFNGRLLSQDMISVPLPKPDVFNVGQNEGVGYIWLTIANSDSGWGQDYTPTADEIKAYFLGWKMAHNNGTTPYDPDKVPINGHKAWIPVLGFDGGNGTPNLPTSIYSAAVAAGWQPYRLQYLKAKPTVEPVRKYELGATLSAGSNMVEVGSGIVIRERANPVRTSANDVLINSNVPGEDTSRLRYKSNKILSIHRNNSADSTWVRQVVSQAYGKERAIWYGGAGFDPTAVYHVTYTMLDPTLAAPFNGTVAANLRGTVSDLVQDVGDVQRRLSVVETQKAEKDAPQRIKATLLNGWSEMTSVTYRKVANFICIEGRVIGGSIADGTTLFVLPQGYRPKVMSEQIIAMVGAEKGYCNLQINTNGEVKFWLGGGDVLFLDRIIFPID